MGIGTKMVLVFASIITIWMISFWLRVQNMDERYQIESLKLNDISSVLVIKKEEGGDKSFLIKEPDRIQAFYMTLKQSVQEKKENFNLKTTKEIYDIEISFTKEHSLDMMLVDVSGGLIQSGGYFYKNKAFYNYCRLQTEKL